MRKESSNLIQDKSYSFALKIVHVSRNLNGEREFILSKQVLRAGTSVGANVEEALGAQSRRDFVSKMSIARKEARECLYWLRLLRDSKLPATGDATPLISECQGMIRMLTAIILSSTRNA